MKRIPDYILIFSVLSSLVFSACSKNFINKTPNDALPIDQALSDSNALQTALLGAYSDLRATNAYGRSLEMLGDLMADNTYVETSNAGRYLANYNYSVTVNDGVALGMWQHLYAVAQRASAIIDSKLTGPMVDQVKAQAYGLRGLVYFKLVNLFAKPYTDDKTALGVPIVLHYDLSNLPKRSSVDSVYQQIVSDFKAAIPNAPEYSASTLLSEYAIKALLARTYLYMGDKTNAETTAVDVINNSPFALVDPAHFAGFWSNPGIQFDATEVMFEVDCDIHNNNGSDDLSLIFSPDGYQDIYASSQLYNLYSATDVRQSLIVPGTTKRGTAAYLVNKFQNGSNPADRDNLKVIRLAEVYLIAAEAASNDGDAQTYLNALVAERDPAFPGYTSVGQALQDDIVTERRKELAFEGDRLSDLNRLKQPINRASNPGSIPGPLTIAYPDNKRVQPIPQSEVQANPNIATQQNPGYN